MQGQLVEAIIGGEQAAQQLGRLFDGQGEGRVAIGDDVSGLKQLSPASRRVERHGHETAVKAAEKRGDIIQSRRIKKNHTVAGQATGLLQVDGNRRGPAVEAPIIDGAFPVLPFPEDIGRSIGLVTRTPGEDLNNRSQIVPFPLHVKAPFIRGNLLVRTSKRTP